MKYLIAATLFLLSTPNLFAQNKCVELFSAVKTEASQQASEETEILKKIEALVKASIDIQLNNFENPSQLQQAKETFEKHLSEIIAVNRKYLDVFKTMRDQKSAELITTIKNESRKEREEQIEKEEKAKDALDPMSRAKKMIFHEILPGKFRMSGAKTTVTITKSFEMSKTQTTQLQWSVIQVLLGKTDPNEINSSNFKNGNDSVTITIKGIDVKMKPAHPVEQVSYDDVMEWITGLNKLSKDGNDAIQKEIQRVIPGHKKGMVYDLPTEAQSAFVKQNRGKNNEIHFDKADDSELEQYAWHDKNSKSTEYPDGSTHEVATKKPRLIDRGDGKIVEFYDLEGNVWEWNKDAWDGRRRLPGGKDPLGETGPYRVFRGGSWTDESHCLSSKVRARFGSSFFSSVIGFRLVRAAP